MHNRRRNITLPLKNIALSAVALIVFLLLFDTVVRFTLGPVPRNNFTGIPSSLVKRTTIPNIPYVLQPNAVGVQEFGSDPDGYFDEGGTLTYRVNSFGFRGAATTEKKPSGTFRIIGIGDSFTFGIGVRAEHTFLAVLEDLLNERDRGGNFEVLNFGVGGYATVEEVAYLERFGLAYNPDAVVICFFLNDTGGGGTSLPFNPATGRALPSWRRLSVVADHLAARVERQQAVRTLVEKYNDSFSKDAKGWREAKWSLSKARALSHENGFQLTLMIFPVLWQLSADYPFRDIHAKIAAYAETLEIPVLDLLPAFQGFDGPELWAHPNNQHPNALGHSIAANALHDFLSEALDLGDTSGQ